MPRRLRRRRLGDIFEQFFGGSAVRRRRRARRSAARRRPRGQVIDLSFEEAVFGAQAPVTVRTAVPCDDCEATGAAPGHPRRTTCPECGGAGQVRRVRQSILGQMVTAAPCPRCSGARHRSSSRPARPARARAAGSRSSTYTVDVPAGVDTGSTLRLTGRGAVGPRGGGVGDLYVHVRVRPHDRFERHGYDLVHELHLSVAQAALGAHLDVRDARRRRGPRRRPAAPRPGGSFRLRGSGRAPRRGPRPGRPAGAASVVDIADRPRPTSRTRCCASSPSCAASEVAPADDGLFSRIRSAFK